MRFLVLEVGGYQTVASTNLVDIGLTRNDHSGAIKELCFCF